MVNPQLLNRAAAARRLLPELDTDGRALLLSYIVWPSRAVLDAESEAEEGEERLRAAFDALLAEVVATAL